MATSSRRRSSPSVRATAGASKRTNDFSEKIADDLATQNELYAEMIALRNAAKYAAWDASVAADVKGIAWESARDVQEQEFIKRFCTEE